MVTTQGDYTVCTIVEEYWNPHSEQVDCEEVGVVRNDEAWPFLVRDKTINMFLKDRKTLMDFLLTIEKSDDLWICLIKKDYTKDQRDFCNIKEGGWIIRVLISIAEKVRDPLFFWLQYSYSFFPGFLFFFAFYTFFFLSLFLYFLLLFSFRFVFYCLKKIFNKI